MKSTIIVRTRFEGFHQWTDAPLEVEFLRSLHRHEFHVSLELAVSHANRELEFILVKRWLDEQLKSGIMNQWMSCEHLCEELYLRVKQKYGHRYCKIEVSEDGENGSILEVDE